MIKGYAKIAKPLTEKLRQPSENITINDEYIKAFETLKEMLINSPILQFPDFNKNFTLTTDASNHAIGAVLSQNSQGKDLPISYASRTLSKREENLSTIEKELLAIVWACKHYKPYLYGKEFIIKTDHKPLQYLHNMKNPSAKFLRWKHQLSDYDFQIQHVQGKTNNVADALSRNPITLNPLNIISTNENEEENEDIIDELINASDEQLDENLEEYAQEQLTELLENITSPKNSQEENTSNQVTQISDPNKCVNIEKNQIYINIGNPKNSRQKSYFGTRTRLLWQVAWPHHENLKNLCLEYLKPNTTYGVYCSNKAVTINEILEDIYKLFEEIIVTTYPSIRIKRYFKANIDVEEKQDQIELVKNYHIGKTCHRGINDTYGKLKTKYYWPCMAELISAYINNCDICKKTKYERNPPKQEYKITPTPTKPFERLQIDTLFFSNRSILTIIDCFSKRLTANIINSTNSVEVIEKLKEYLTHFPTPVEIQADNGKEFANKGLSNFLAYNNISLYFTTPHHHNSNGLINRAHSTLIELLNILQLENPKLSLEKILQLAVIAYNNTPNGKLKLSPNEITFGVIFPTEQNEATIFEIQTEEYHKEKQLIHKAIKTLITQEKEERTGNLNQNRESLEIPDGRIFIKTHTRNKAKPKFKPAVFDNERNKIITGVNKESKIHPSQLKRPRKLENHENYELNEKCHLQENEKNENDFGINILDWPPLSPDLNPIENLWRIMAREVYNIQKPEIQNLDELKERITQAWENIPESTLINLVRSVPKRLLELENAKKIAADGNAAEKADLIRSDPAMM
ncbi:hypothetical protein O3M35_000769 [Rhynocoris fuscipes]|uniref:RNA-directed DNA polymerase n=2 Tax=Rhynocoris fuscipes TaxID=488301 RepID=A0AAW1DMS0_9HEMI